MCLLPDVLPPGESPAVLRRAVKTGESGGKRGKIAPQDAVVNPVRLAVFCAEGQLLAPEVYDEI
jgi:hypothetical protein